MARIISQLAELRQGQVQLLLHWDKEFPFEISNDQIVFQKERPAESDVLKYVEHDAAALGLIEEIDRLRQNLPESTSP